MRTLTQLKCKLSGVFITILRKHITDENYKQLMKDAKKEMGEDQEVVVLEDIGK